MEIIFNHETKFEKLNVKITVTLICIHFFKKNLPEKTISICTGSTYNQNDTVKGLSKSEFIKLFSFGYNRLLFFFNGSLYKQRDGEVVG